jgi:hypothetical protein
MRAADAMHVKPSRYTSRRVMPPRSFDLIAFDGDDTLWHNERSYRDARDADPPHHAGGRYCELPALAELPRLVETIEQAARATTGDASPI